LILYFKIKNRNFVIANSFLSWFIWSWMDREFDSRWVLSWARWRSCLSCWSWWRIQACYGDFQFFISLPLLTFFLFKKEYQEWISLHKLIGNNLSLFLLLHVSCRFFVLNKITKSSIHKNCECILLFIYFAVE